MSSVVDQNMTEAKPSTRSKLLKPTPKIVNIGETYFGSAHKECKPFKLASTFLEPYGGKKPNFGFNGLGEFVFYRTYSRDKAEGGKESFLDVAKRVVEGCYEIQRRHCLSIHIPWDYERAQDSAQEMFERIWSFKFLPPGRGLWMMGTDFMFARGSAALNNCGMTSTDMKRHTDPAEPYCFMMDMSMLGVGIGFDTKGAGQVEIQRPNPVKYVEYEVHDSREGWVDSLRTLLHSYTKKAGNGEVVFNYEKIRPAGSQIGGFGGTAAGANILSDMHQMFRSHLDRKVGKTLSSGDIVDLMNYIGKCVVAGNVRRTAQIAFGEAGDEEYSSLKNPYAFMPDNIKSMIQEKEGMAWGRATNSVAYLDVTDFDTSSLTSEEIELLTQGTIQWSALNNHRWASNNSVFAKVGMPYKQYEKDIATNGEPGFLWLENCRNFGRMIDGYKEGVDGEVVGSNPCSEQSLEDSELCCLVESFPSLHQDDEDYKRTLKFAFLYAKSVTLLPTHSARTNAVMLRNRRIGLSQSGIVQAFAQFGRREVLSKFCDEGYNVIKQWDKVYSKWLCIPQSIKITSVKPSGTVSLLTGCTPGIHYPEAQHYWRRVRLKGDSPLVQILKESGYHIEPSVTDPANTVVVKFAVSDARVKPTDEISIWEQVANTVDYQRYWADNQVSVTIKFKAEEAKDIVSVLEAYEDQLKSVCFLPHSNHGYAQAPYEPCTEQEVLEYNAKLSDLDFSSYYGKEEGSNFCDSDSCAV